MKRIDKIKTLLIILFLFALIVCVISIFYLMQFCGADNNTVNIDVIKTYCLCGMICCIVLLYLFKKL